MNKDRFDNQEKVPSWLIIVLKIICFFICVGIHVISTGFFAAIVKYPNDTEGNIARIALIAIIYAVLVVIYFLSQGDSNPNKFLIGSNLNFTPNDKNKWRIIAIIIVIIIDFVTQYILGQFKLNYNLDSASSNVNLTSQINLATIIMVIYILVIAPIIEEIIYRGLLYNLIFKNISNKNNQYWLLIIGGIISGAIFSCIHAPASLIEFFEYAIPGFLYYLLYLEFYDIKNPIFVHMLWNIMTLFIKVP